MRIKLAVGGMLVLLVAACSPKLEEGELLQKEGDTFTIRLVRTISAPIDRVWQAFQTPENLEKYAEAYQQTKLVKSEGNVKVVDYRVTALGQVNAFTMQLTMVPEEKRVKLKTLESTLVEIDGEYELKPGPDGTSTIITYRAKQKDKIDLPAPVSVQKSAINDTFAGLVAGIEKSIEVEG